MAAVAAAGSRRASPTRRPGEGCQLAAVEMSGKAGPEAAARCSAHRHQLRVLAGAAAGVGSPGSAPPEPARAASRPSQAGECGRNEKDTRLAQPAAPPGNPLQNAEGYRAPPLRAPP